MTPATEHRSGSPIRETQTLQQADFNRFARLSGDHNPIHVDPAFSARTRFGATVSHGMLLFTLLRGLIARHYPDTRMTYQALKFPAPAYAGEQLTLEVLPQAPTAPRATRLLTRIRKADGRLCLEGTCHLTPKQAHQQPSERDKPGASPLQDKTRP